MGIELRADRVAFRISGPDATHLLHDVLTPPVKEEADLTRWFALLTPQGKIIAEGLIGWAGDAYWLDVHKSVAEAFFKRMKMYRLRAKVEIEMLNESHRVGWSAIQTETGICHKDPRANEMGFRIIAAAEIAADWAEGTGQAGARIAAGIAELGPDFPTEDAFPHDLGMDQRDAIDFKKGCYVGQEVVSRMQHRGTARRRPAIVSGLPENLDSQTLTVDGKSVGTFGQVVAGQAVAIVRIDKIDDPENVVAGDTPVTLALPEWARYAFGSPGGDSDD
ncbi:CAF17-like 4Fe-4S cluster assembly/insertion protein YgfZ [Pelagibacterium lentulum]|uniref:Aminomethyltransferase n=1 Tax=Pelagibacterium lentulum TaxID=2029865 RepID=A0A916VZM3_9HYPH|nr:folate-binding protein YgfZ [Pelagibacterium lentulum]GGA55749.1 aminomethyltransferase [Pelagibacterium lentulum]